MSKDAHAPDAPHCDLLETTLLHDLKNQAHHLIVGLEQLPFPAEAADQRRRLLNEARSLGDGLTSLLLNLRLSRGQYALQEENVGLARLLEEVREDLLPVAAQQQLEISCAADQHLYHLLDETLVHSALRSLADNALRHASKQVLLSATADGARLHLQVEDDGPGFDEAETASGFQPASRRTGLGLQLAAEIAAAHRAGKVHGELERGRSTQLGGARVTLTLP